MSASTATPHISDKAREIAARVASSGPLFSGTVRAVGFDGSLGEPTNPWGSRSYSDALERILGTVAWWNGVEPDQFTVDDEDDDAIRLDGVIVARFAIGLRVVPEIVSVASLSEAA